MKYIFGVNLTENKKNDVIDGHIFRYHYAGMLLGKYYQKGKDIEENITKKTTLPKSMRIIKNISIYLLCY